MELATVDRIGELVGDAEWPKPVGWRILIDPMRPKATTKGGIAVPTETQTAETFMNYVGRVVAMGELCYKHGKFEGGTPWCKVGDWVAYGQHAGQTLTVRDVDAERRKRVLQKKVAATEVEADTVTRELRLAEGKRREAIEKERISLAGRLKDERAELYDAESATEHRLRIVNDDEIIAVIPDADLIRIYV